MIKRLVEWVLPTDPGVIKLYEGGKSWVLWDLMDIPDNTDGISTYLRRRIVVKTPWFAVYLHRILLPDTDFWSHNHPFAFWSWVLSGGYVEHRLTRDLWASVRDRDRWSLAFTGLDDFHKITVLESPTFRQGVVTLVLCGPRRQEWGFITTEGFVTWQEMRDRGESRVP